ncbi:MAG: hypothetical protein ABJQ26_08525 [Maricaulis sp.]|uniref:hypothetical protein n=1 Tax=Maricaulis sp. TaxID=1486257 RepID=UPI003296EF71
MSFPEPAGAASTVQAGLPFEVSVELLPPRDQRYGWIVGQLSTVYSVWLSLIDTGSITVTANGRPARRADLRTMGTGAFESVTNTLFTGEVEVDGLLGTRRGNTISIGQAFRAPLRVRSIKAEVRLPHVG